MLKIKNNVGGSGGKDIIAFQIGQDAKIGSIYYAESGMTWAEFINSEYNINSYFWTDDVRIGAGAVYVGYSNSASSLVHNTDVIESKHRYFLVNTGGRN